MSKNRGMITDRAVHYMKRKDKKDFANEGVGEKSESSTL